MIKKSISALLLCGLLVGSLASCSQAPVKVMEIGDLSTDGSLISGNGTIYTADSNYIDESVFKYMYLYFKGVVLDNYKSYEEQGYNVTGDPDISVGDTEAFWNCVLGKDEEGNEITAKQYLYNSTVELFEDLLAYEKLADAYGYRLPETYKSQLEKSISDYITQNSSRYFDSQGDIEITDKDGNVLEWVKNRWKMDLARENFTAEDWERVFYMYPSVVIKDLTTQLSDSKIILPSDDSTLREQGEKELAESLEKFLKNNIKLKVIEYVLKPEEKQDESSGESSTANETSDDYSYVDSSEADFSDDTSSDASGDISSDNDDELSAKEYNEKLKEKCNSIYQGLLDGTLDFDEQIKLSDVASTVEKNPDGFVVTVASFEAFSGQKADELKVGDIKIYITDDVIDIIQVQELTKQDSGYPETPTDEDMEALRAQSISDAFEALLNKYKDTITVNEDVLEKYLEPWKFN